MNRPRVHHVLFAATLPLLAAGALSAQKSAKTKAGPRPAPPYLETQTYIRRVHRSYQESAG